MQPKLLIAALVTFLTSTAIAQRNFTVVQLSYESDLNHNGFSRYQFTSNIPLKRSAKHIVLVSPSAELLGVPHAMETPGGLALPFTFIRNGSNKWSFQVTLIPRMNDLQFETNNLQLGVMALATLKRNDSLRFRLGMYYNSEYFGGFFVPLAGIDYKINNKTYLYGTLPGSLTFEKLYGETFSAGINFRSFTGSYISGFLFPHPVRRYPIRLSESKLLVFAEKEFSRNLSLRAELGHTITRRFTYYNYDSTGNMDYEKGSAFFNFTFAYRLKNK